MRVSYHLALLLTLAACSDSSEPAAPPPEFVVSPASQWAGGTVLVRSPFFDGLDSLPTITAAGIEMVTARIDDSTLSVTLPTLPTQTAAIEVIDGTTSYLVDSMGIVGYRGRTDASPAAMGNPVVVATPGGPIGIGVLNPQPPGGAIVLVDLALAQAEVVTGVGPVNEWWRGVGVTYDPARFILRDSTGTVGEWQVHPTLIRTDTVPSAVWSTLNGGDVARLSASVWLHWGPHSAAVYHDSVLHSTWVVEDPWAIKGSILADRALLSAWYPAGDARAFDLSAGDPVFDLPLTSIGGAVFTGDAGILYAAGGGAANNESLVTVNAASGAVVRLVPLPPSGRVFAVALDATEQRIFVMVERGNVPEILVFDASSMDLVGRLLPDPGAACDCPGGLDAAGIVDASTSMLYVMGHDMPASTVIWKFDLLP